MSFAEYFLRVFGHEAPAVLCFAQGAQFAVSRDTLRRVPRATFEQLLKWIDEEQRIEVVYYLVRVPHAAATLVLAHAVASTTFVFAHTVALAKPYPHASALLGSLSLPR